MPEGENQGGASGEPSIEERIDAAVAAKLAGNDVKAAVGSLVRENFGYREKLREAKKNIPAEGSVVLAADEAKAWETYRKLGDPVEVGKRLDEGSASTTELRAILREKTLEQAAEIAGLKGNKVFKKLAGGLDIAIEKTGEDKDGEPVLEAFVKGEDGKKTKLKQYATAEWGDVLDALQVDPSSNRPYGTPPRRAPGTPPPPSANDPALQQRLALQRSGRYDL